jgi:cytosine/adenosine deaminase-related metal-dependent hydrolase
VMRGDALTFVNATLSPGTVGTLRILGDQIAALNQPPQPGDHVVDLNGDRLLPGLINAHDHLHLNNLPRLEYRAPYPNAREWIEDVRSRMQTDRAFRAAVAISRNDRLLQGGIKNLLSGVTTVAHHDPLYPFLSSAEYPTRVVRYYGWSHSLYIDGEEKVQRSHHDTPAEWPWIIHAAEGTDGESARELERLEALGCLSPNTLIVHGVALDPAQQATLRRSGAGLIWCPASNLRLFGTTVEVIELAARGCVALGSDSRLTGAHDLLEELRVAADVSGLDEETLEAIVTHDSARLLRLTDRGVLAAGALADLLVLPRRVALSKASRADVRLVMVDGIVRYGDRDCVALADPGADWVSILVDGCPKLLDRNLAALLQASEARESGLELPAETWRAA